MMKRRTTLRLAPLGLSASSAMALLMASCTTPDGFKTADTSGDGRVGSAEFERYMLEAIYAEADANRDKKITFEEWRVANPDTPKSRFKIPDKNRDGAVSPEEAKRHFDREGTLEDLFDKIDSDNDGYVTKEETVAFKKKLDEQSGTPLQKLSRATSE